jgi:MFS transporter, DHA1 family, solute carrier family 18 (vesicular amine transporter), member 1/2
VHPSRRITLAVGVSMFVDAALYLAVIPQLPDYVERFGLSSLGAGAVIAAYPLAVPFVSIGCIALVPLVGAKRITLASAALMAVATLIFAFAPNALLLILARFVQGVASGSIWTASMSWVTDNAPPGRRGRESGIAMGMLSAGSVAGPGVGALASWAGQELAYSLVAATSLVGVILTVLAPSGRTVDHQPAIRVALVRVARERATLGTMALAAVDLLIFGASDLLVPLQLGDRGVAVAAIAAALGAGAVLGAIVGPLAGRAVDRYGPAQVGLVAASLMTPIPVVLAFQPASAVQLAILVVAGPLFAVGGAAMFPLSSRGADAAGVSHVTATGLVGAAWALGFTVVPLLVGALAGAVSFPAAYLAVLALSLPAVAFLTRGDVASAGGAAAAESGPSRAR